MDYAIEFKPRSIRDLQAIPANYRARVLEKVNSMRRDLAGDVKRLTNFTPRYRLRVGDYRVLFEVDGPTVTIYRVINRRDAYR